MTPRSPIDTRPSHRALAWAAAFAATHLLAAPASAAEHVINMLNQGKEGTMTFEPSYVRAAVGDTVVFKPTQAGAHYPASLALPAGAKPWRGEVDKEFRVKLEKEGVYAYVCEPHKIMGMVGVIQAGKPVNLAAVREVTTKEQTTWAMNKDRFDKALAQVK